jgi:hypothetical protein
MILANWSELLESKHFFFLLFYLVLSELIADFFFFFFSKNLCQYTYYYLNKSLIEIRSNTHEQHWRPKSIKQLNDISSHAYD